MPEGRFNFTEVSDEAATKYEHDSDSRKNTDIRKEREGKENDNA